MEAKAADLVGFLAIVVIQIRFTSGPKLDLICQRNRITNPLSLILPSSSSFLKHADVNPQLYEGIIDKSNAIQPKTVEDGLSYVNHQL